MTAVALLMIRRARRRHRMLGIAVGYWLLRRMWLTDDFSARPPLWARASTFMLLGPGMLDRR